MVNFLIFVLLCKIMVKLVVCSRHPIDGHFYFLLTQIKPLPPRPLEEAPGAAALPSPLTGSVTTSATPTSHGATMNNATLTTTATSAPSTVHSSYQTVTPPAGYPPLPPGYTLTQPMAPPSTTTVPTSVASHAAHLQSSVSQPAMVSIVMHAGYNLRTCFVLPHI